MKSLLFLSLLLSCSLWGQDLSYTTDTFHYYSPTLQASDDYLANRCVLEVYYPENKANYATVVWFHGGGLTGGKMHIPERLRQQGVAVIAVNYRLYPKVKAPVYIEDAAAAVAWTFKNINSLGGDSTQIFLSGHSAGGYLSLMVGMDKHYLAAYHIDANTIAGLIPFSGHTITHFTVRQEHGISGKQPIIDAMAPLYHVRADAPPLLMITGDRELEMLGRYEENAYMMRMMKVVGHQNTRLYELDGYDHSMTEPAFPLLLKAVEEWSR